MLVKSERRAPARWRRGFPRRRPSLSGNRDFGTKNGAFSATAWFEASATYTDDGARHDMKLTAARRKKSL